jgi:hypothetical protein
MASNVAAEAAAEVCAAEDPYPFQFSDECHHLFYLNLWVKLEYSHL